MIHCTGAWLLNRFTLFHITDKNKLFITWDIKTFILYNIVQKYKIFNNQLRCFLAVPNIWYISLIFVLFYLFTWCVLNLYVLQSSIFLDEVSLEPAITHLGCKCKCIENKINISVSFTRYFGCTILQSHLTKRLKWISFHVKSTSCCWTVALIISTEAREKGLLWMNFSSFLNEILIQMLGLIQSKVQSAPRVYLYTLILVELCNRVVQFMDVDDGGKFGRKVCCLWL